MAMTRVRTTLQLTSDMLTPHLIGAMVRYDGGFEPEYGLVASYNAETQTVFVRYGLGDTPEGCGADELKLCAASMTESDRDSIFRTIEHIDIDSRVNLSLAMQQVVKILLHQ